MFSSVLRCEVNLLDHQVICGILNLNPFVLTITWFLIVLLQVRTAR